MLSDPMVVPPNGTSTRDGVFVGKKKCITVQELCRVLGAKVFADVLQCFKRCYYETVICLLQRSNMNVFRTSVMHSLDASNVEEAISIIKAGLKRELMAMFSVLQKKSWC